MKRYRAQTQKTTGCRLFHLVLFLLLATAAAAFQAFTTVIVPLVAPAVFSTAILVFIFASNDFLLVLSLISTNDARTVPAAIAFFIDSSRFEPPTGSIAAAAVSFDHLKKNDDLFFLLSQVSRLQTVARPGAVTGREAENRERIHTMVPVI